MLWIIEHRAVGIRVIIPFLGPLARVRLQSVHNGHATSIIGSNKRMTHIHNIRFIVSAVVRAPLWNQLNVTTPFGVAGMRSPYVVASQGEC